MVRMLNLGPWAIVLDAPKPLCTSIHMCSLVAGEVWPSTIRLPLPSSESRWTIATDETGVIGADNFTTHNPKNSDES